MLRPRLLILLVATVMLTACVVPVASATTVRTLLTTRLPINSFVQDGNHVAWGVCPDSGLVGVRSLSTGSMRTISFYPGFAQCDLDGPPYGLALAGARVLWDEPSVSEGGDTYYGDELYTAALGSRGRPRIDFVAWETYDDNDPEVLGPTAGDGLTLVYSVVRVRCTTGEDPYECRSFTVSGGEVKRILGRSARTLPSVPPAALLAASHGRIALAPAARWRSRPFLPAENGPVEIRSASTGSPIVSFEPVGTVRALALSGTTAAVLVAAPSGNKRIERYAIASGNRLGSTPVSPTTVAELDMAGNRIVYRTGRTIRLLDSRAGRSRRLLTTGARPIGLSIEGRRVAWAVNRRFQGRETGRIQSLTLARR